MAGGRLLLFVCQATTWRRRLGGFGLTLTCGAIVGCKGGLSFLYLTGLLSRIGCLSLLHLGRRPEDSNRGIPGFICCFSDWWPPAYNPDRLPVGTSKAAFHLATTLPFSPSTAVPCHDTVSSRINRLASLDLLCGVLVGSVDDESRNNCHGQQLFGARKRRLVSLRESARPQQCCSRHDIECARFVFQAS